MIKWLQNYLISWGQTEIQADIIARTLFCLVLLLAVWLVYLVFKGPVLRLLERLVVETTTKIKWDDVLLQEHFFHRIISFLPVLLLYQGIPQALKDTTFETPARTLLAMLLVILGMLIVDSLINTARTIYDTRVISKKIPISPFVQVLKIFLYFITLILLASMLLNKSPLFLISGLGAITAVLLLVFKDTLMGFVAGIQLISNRMIGKGDWISMPSYGADGDVKEITLATVKVENWDKTITTIPTYALISESFKNWKNMTNSGGRRIKRSIHIDMSCIKFCDNEMLERFSEIHRLKKFLNDRIRVIEEHNRTIIKDHSSIVDLRNLTNIGVLRYYIEHYLKEHPKIHKDSDKWTFMIRQLSPGENGLPLEVYVFSNDVRWEKYEELMSDIFDHILAVIPLFDLRVFQNPTGSDFRHWLPAPDTSSTVPMP